MKRVFDLFWTLLGLTLLWPLFVCVAALVKLEDGGPVFYRQVRVGRYGIPFRIWKFRTMAQNADRKGPLLTIGRDPRITRVGHWLRRLKLDEFPQLFNVLCGEMSLVGPRPEVARYVDLYSAEQRRVLSLAPGVTDIASIKFRDESSLLGQASDPERVYREVIMPTKLGLNLDYAKRASVWNDFQVILQTLSCLFFRGQAEQETTQASVQECAVSSGSQQSVSQQNGAGQKKKPSAEEFRQGFDSKSSSEFDPLDHAA